MPEEGGLSEEAANAIWDVLVELAGAPESDDARFGFVYHQTERFCSEYRFGGSLRFGGKFWRNDTRRPDGSYGERWYVTYYREDETLDIREITEATNARLDALREEHHG